MKMQEKKLREERRGMNEGKDKAGPGRRKASKGKRRESLLLILVLRAVVGKAYLRPASQRRLLMFLAKVGEG